jgi:predicted RNA-binding protein with PIN domain
LIRTLIDGYNLMYEGGLLGKRLGPDGFRKVRTRFLNDLADALGPLESARTTVVFDAAAAPPGVPRVARHKGLSVVYAVDDENADARIERLLAEHTSPKSLTVVSTDRRVRQAATRRRAQVMTADAFWVSLAARKRERRFGTPELPKAPPATPPPSLSPEESAYWQNEFRDLERLPETREALGDGAPMLTDEEIAEIEREIEREPD